MKSELPSTFNALRFQQHRWSCGPANLFRKMVMETVRNKVSFLKKIMHYLKIHFFFTYMSHLLKVFFICIDSVESDIVEEILCHIQFLLCSEDHCSHGHLFLLLCCASLNRIGS